MNDVHLIHLMNQVGLDPNKDIHYLYVIENFTQKVEERETGWMFRIAPNGKKNNKKRNQTLDK